MRLENVSVDTGALIASGFIDGFVLFFQSMPLWMWLLLVGPIVLAALSPKPRRRRR